MAQVMDDIMKLCCKLSNDDQIQVAVKNSAKGAAMAGGGAFVCGLLAGPAGIAVGGTVGGLLGCWLTSGQFKPLPQILTELPPSHKQKLVSEVQTALGNLDWKDVTMLITMVTSNAGLMNQVKAALMRFVTNELKADVKYGD